MPFHFCVCGCGYYINRTEEQLKNHMKVLHDWLPKYTDILITIQQDIYQQLDEPKNDRRVRYIWMSNVWEYEKKLREMFEKNNLWTEEFVNKWFAIRPNLYEKGRCINSGGSKIVWEATRICTGTTVAFIQSHRPLPESITLPNDIQILLSLEHDNIIKVLDYWKVPSSFPNKFEWIYITELGNFDLRTYLEKTKSELGYHIKLNWSFQLIDVLAYIHDRNIMHGDIKCRNLLTTGPYDLKVIDFDMAKYMTGSHEDDIGGTPHSMAPEVYSGKYNLSADIWSYGMCLLHIETQTRPFANKSGIEILYILCNKKQLPFELIDKVKDPFFKELILDCLDFDPDKRPTAKQILTRFKNISNAHV